MRFHPQSRPRHLLLALGDQLYPDSAAFDGFAPTRDAVWIAEVTEESKYVWSQKARIALFLSGMRHFKGALRERGIVVHYLSLDHKPAANSLARELTATARRLRPQRLLVVEPGGMTGAAKVAGLTPHGALNREAVHSPGFTEIFSCPAPRTTACRESAHCDATEGPDAYQSGRPPCHSKMRRTD